MEDNKDLKNILLPLFEDTVIENVEWAFQFNDGEPVPFAWPNNDVKKLDITLGNSTSSNIIFKDKNNNEFKIFARERK